MCGGCGGRVCGWGFVYIRFMYIHVSVSYFVCFTCVLRAVVCEEGWKFGCA